MDDKIYQLLTARARACVCVSYLKLLNNNNLQQIIWTIEDQEIDPF